METMQMLAQYVLQPLFERMNTPEVRGQLEGLVTAIVETRRIVGELDARLLRLEAAAGIQPGGPLEHPHQADGKVVALANGAGKPASARERREAPE